MWWCKQIGMGGCNQTKENNLKFSRIDNEEGNRQVPIQKFISIEALKSVNNFKELISSVKAKL